MYRIALVLVTLSSCLFSQLAGQLQKATGQTDFDYFNEDAKSAAAKFVSYLDMHDSSEQELIDELKSQYTIHGYLVDECAASLPSGDSTDLNKAVKEALVKIQTIDNDLRSNSVVCSSLRVPESKGCRKARELSLELLANLSTEQEYEEINQLVKEDIESDKEFMQNCINANVSL